MELTSLSIYCCTENLQEAASLAESRKGQRPRPELANTSKCQYVSVVLSFDTGAKILSTEKVRKIHVYFGMRCALEH